MIWSIAADKGAVFKIHIQSKTHLDAAKNGVIANINWEAHKEGN